MAIGLGELQDQVYTITNRPDLVQETSLAIRNETLKAHSSDNFYKDIFQTGIQWSPVDYIQSLDYKALVPRYRKFKYLRKYYPAMGTETQGRDGDFFTLIVPEISLDDYGINRENVCYVAGSFINIRSSTQDQYMIFGCYVHPDVTELGYNSWIADEYTPLIVNRAAMKIAISIGFQDRLQSLMFEIQEWAQILKQEATAGGE
jgi:hypothetical protein